MHRRLVGVVCRIAVLASIAAATGVAAGEDTGLAYFGLDRPREWTSTITFDTPEIYYSPYMAVSQSRHLRPPVRRDDPEEFAQVPRHGCVALVTGTVVGLERQQFALPHWVAIDGIVGSTGTRDTRELLLFNVLIDFVLVGIVTAVLAFGTPLGDRKWFGAAAFVFLVVTIVGLTASEMVLNNRLRDRYTAQLGDGDAGRPA
jgi:hypothetical protein